MTMPTMRSRGISEGDTSHRGTGRGPWSCPSRLRASTLPASAPGMGLRTCQDHPHAATAHGTAPETFGAAVLPLACARGGHIGFHGVPGSSMGVPAYPGSASGMTLWSSRPGRPYTPRAIDAAAPYLLGPHAMSRTVITPNDDPAFRRRIPHTNSPRFVH